jgi:DNA-binding CsgD family transcriptional regulator
MDPSLDAAIDLVEASYDLEVPVSDWLPKILRAGGPLLDLGMGCYGMISSGISDEGVPLVTQMQGSPGAEDLPFRVMEAAQEAGPDLVREASQGVRGKVYLLSEMRERWPKAYEVITRHVGCKDILSMTAVDPDGCGVDVSVPSSELLSLDRRERQYWQMLEVHLAAGHRLRRGLGQQSEAKGVPLTEVPLAAEALIDPKRFLVSHATGEAQHADAARGIREAARLVDKARGPLRKNDPEEALRLWQGLVRGRWTLVDWFDSDGRRFVLAKRNAPRIKDPRGLTEREAQVATYASLGETSKLIGYRLGLSQSYVSRLLRDAMRKLGVKTQAQLVERMRFTPSEGAA